MHPTNRAERRHQRTRIIEFRTHRDLNSFHRYRDAPGIFVPVWGRYAKWNGDCGSTMCHAAKYFKVKAKRRKARKSSWSQAQCRAGDRKVYC
jgi:hypothetical protein